MRHHKKERWAGKDWLPEKKPWKGLGSSLGASGRASLAAEAASWAACLGCSGAAAFIADSASLAASLGCSGMLAASGVSSLLPPACRVAAQAQKAWHILDRHPNLKTLCLQTPPVRALVKQRDLQSKLANVHCYSACVGSAQSTENVSLA